MVPSRLSGSLERWDFCFPALPEHQGDGRPGSAEPSPTARMNVDVIRESQTTEAHQVSDAAGFNHPAGRDRVVVREGLEPVATLLCPAHRLLALALI